MIGDQIDQILVYPPKYQKQVQVYIKRLPISQFKAIDLNRIKSQFAVLDTSSISSQNTLHLGEHNKNRYSDILAYKHNRVIIENIEDFYINASLMKSVLDNEVYAIFAQAPVAKVVEHFWYACYHYNIKRIIMLCAFLDPRRGNQAEKYWPELGKTIVFKNTGVSIICQKQEKLDEDYIKFTIAMQGSEGTRYIEHIHWTAWSDMKKPQGKKSEELFKSLVDDCIKLIDNHELFIVHCSAGIGRTGTLGTMIQAVRCAQKKGELSIFQIVDYMRRHRMSCVQTFQQYSFIYQELAKIL